MVSSKGARRRRFRIDTVISDCIGSLRGLGAGESIRIINPILFCIYIVYLLHDLTKLGVGCYIVTFVCASDYADIVLTVPSANAMR